MGGGEVIVACCQVPLAVGDVAGNRAAVAAAVREAAARKAGVVVVPELAQSGYVFTGSEEARALAERVDGPTMTQWQALSAELGIVLVGGFCEFADDDRVHNSAVIVDTTGVRAVYRKAHLWDREKLVFVPGDAPPPVVATASGRIAVMVCYDVEFPEWVRLAALAGAELLCVPTNWPDLGRPDGERPAEVVRVQAQASMNRLFIAACDRAGAERGTAWVGGSVIVDPDGWPLDGPLTAPESGLVLAPCRLPAAGDKRTSEHNDAHGDRRPELYALHATRE